MNQSEFEADLERQGYQVFYGGLQAGMVNPDHAHDWDARVMVLHQSHGLGGGGSSNNSEDHSSGSADHSSSEDHSGSYSTHHHSSSYSGGGSYSSGGGGGGAIDPSCAPAAEMVPFANISGDPEQEYFAGGMVEEIITPYQ